MLEHHAKLFYYATRKLYSLQVTITEAIRERGVESLPTVEEADKTRDLIERIEREAERLQFSGVLERLSAFHTDDELLQPLAGSVFTLNRLHFQLEELDKDIQRAFGGTKFLMIPAGEASYYNLKHPFGEVVYNNFPSARHDAREARNCHALDRNTACVFHLMRALEHGLRALARKIRVKAPASAKLKKRRPVDLEEWRGLIERIEKKIEAMEKQKKTSQRQERLQFYHGAASQFRHFKNAWRNYVMHSHESYDRREADGVMAHTEEFMRHLAESGVRER